LDAVQNWLDDNPQAMRRRRETVEHPFGTIKLTTSPHAGATSLVMSLASLGARHQSLAGRLRFRLFASATDAPPRCWHGPRTILTIGWDWCADFGRDLATF
jgi:hypothetical protein